MTNDSLSSVVICQSPSQERKREKEEKFLCFVGERDTFFSKARKDF